jgi:hypothetical protein
MSGPEAGKDHWHGHARQWSRIGSPLRPCAEDVARIRSAVERCGDRGLILGATPELAGMTPGTVSVDRNPEMIARLRGDRGCSVVGEWLDLPFDGEVFDFVAGDGSVNALPYADYEDLFARLRGLLKASGRLALRVFAAPVEPERVEDVFEAAHRRGIGSFHAFKWHLAMALAAEGGGPDIRVADIHEAFRHWVPDRVRFAERTGWSMEHINTIDVYDRSSIVYSFPTEQAVAAQSLRPVPASPSGKFEEFVCEMPER